MSANYLFVVFFIINKMLVNRDTLNNKKRFFLENNQGSLSYLNNIHKVCR